MTTREKNKKRKVEKLRRKAYTPQVPAITQFVINNTSLEELATPRQPRWEFVRIDDDTVAIHDSLTGYHAVHPAGADMEERLNEEIAELTAGKLVIEVYSWTHLASDSIVVNLKTENENGFFHLLHNPDHGYAIHDRTNGKVHPMNPVDEEHALDVVKGYNDDPARELGECLRQALEDPTKRHWMTAAEWFAPAPEDHEPGLMFIEPVGHIQDPIPEPVAEPVEAPADAPAAPLTPVLDPLRVLVAGSSTWGHIDLVGSVIQELWNARGNPPLVILTSGSPYGPEAAAQVLAKQVDGVEHEVVEDEDIVNAGIDYAFVFQTDGSVGIDELKRYLKAADITVHWFVEQRPTDRWRDR